MALLIGAAAIVVAIVLTDDGSAPASTSGPELAALASSARSLSTVAERLSDAAGDQGAAAAPDAPQVATTLREALDGYAASIGLDSGRFDECLAASATYDAVGDQLQRGLNLGVNGTPTFYINNKVISGAQPASVFAEMIAAELAGSPTSVEEYSADIQVLANGQPPAFAIVGDRPDITGAPVEGNPDARVVIVEFSDFQCAFCQRWYNDTLPGIRDLIGDVVAIAFLHFPITQIHPNAAIAHAAAQCAAEQDKFREMHDLLFEQQDVWARLPDVN